MMRDFAATHESNIRSTETDLIYNAKKGDLDAFNHLVLQYQDRVYNLAARILGDSDQAEDIVQNTFLTAYLNLPRFRNGSFIGWLCRIATNACYDEYRKHKKYPMISIDNDDLAEERVSPLVDFPGSTVLPEIEYERHELARIIQNALNQLDVDQRAVVVLVDQQEFDYRETAQILRIPVGTVKSRLARARLRLQGLLSNSINVQ